MSTALVVIGISFVIMTIVGGMDLTNLFTSPVRLIEKLGTSFHGMVRRFTKSPNEAQKPSLTSSIGRFGANVAVVQLIQILPMPFNILLFFLYYKFATWIIVCLIPSLLAIWAFTQVYACRKELKNIDEIYRPLVESTEEPEIIQLIQDIRKPLNTAGTSRVIIKEPPKNQMHTANHIHTQGPEPVYRHVPHKSSELYPNV